MNRDRKRWDVLITNASTRVAYTLLRSLARSGLNVGLGVDSNSGMALHSRYCAGSFRHPSSDVDPAGFMAALQGILAERRPSVYLPADEDVFVVAEHLQLKRDLAVRTAIAPIETLRLLDHKHRSLVLADGLGIPTPATILPASMGEIRAFAAEHSGPLVFKLVRSSGARGVHLLPREHWEAMLPDILRKSGSGFGDFIIQEFVSGTGYGVSLLFDHGEMKAVFAHRRLRERSPAGGPSTLRQSVRQPVLEAQAEKLLRQVGYHGVAMVEFKYDEASGKSWFLEVNPRWWGSVALAIRAGVDFPVLYHRLAMGEKLPAPPDYRTGVRVRWLLGDLFALSNRTFPSGPIPAWRDLWPKVEGYDDAHLDDPVPLAAELVLYLMKVFPSRERK